MNNSKVINARIFLNRETGGKIEFLLLEHSSDFYEWKGICNRTKKIKIGEKLIGGDGIEGIISLKERDEITIRFKEPLTYNELSTYGKIPLPPYIANRRPIEEDDYERYQTVYAKTLGSLASPTAGLHFTKDVLERLKGKGVNIAYITLHVSAGTFLPIKSEHIENHNMHYEEYFIEEEIAKLINCYLENINKKITCVGTTSLRTLENELIYSNFVKEGNKSTNIFIYPGFNFKGANRLITNFHTPKSTPLLLVSAFAGIDLIKKAYKIAIKEKLRFYSYGDSMMIL